MNHDEWLEALLDAWDELSGMNMYFENVNFAEDPDGDTITANEALSYAYIHPTHLASFLEHFQEDTS